MLMRLLMIVGEDDFAIVLKHALRAVSATLNIDCAKTFCEAEDMLRQTAYDVVLCDGDLSPQCRSTARATERIKKLREAAKVVFMTSPNSNSESFAMADRVIQKPFTSSDIVMEIANAIAQN